MEDRRDLRLIRTGFRLCNRTRKAVTVLMAAVVMGCGGTSTSQPDLFSQVKIDSNTRVFFAGSVSSFDEAKRSFDVPKALALSVPAAKQQFPVVLSNSASINTAQPAADMQGGQSALMEFNTKLLPAILKDTGIKPGSGVYDLIAEQSKKNVQEGTFTKFTVEDSMIKLIRYKSLGAGTGMYDQIESGTFEVSGEPLLSDKSLWQFDQVNLKPRSR